MTAAVCVEPGRIEIEEVPLPKPARGEALVRVAFSGICGSDIRGFKHTHPEINRYPIILGHECSGTVVEIGAGGDNVTPGDHVAIEPLFTCDKCPACLRGDYHQCAKLQLLGHQRPGTFAEYVAAPTRFMHHLPSNMSFETGAFAEPAAVTVHASRKAGIGVDDLVVILGCGPIGLLMVQTARAAGARVVAADIVNSKVSLATRLGAIAAFNVQRTDVVAKVAELTDGLGADIVIECAGVPETLEMTVDLCRKGGTIVPLGWTGNPTDPINLTMVTIKELRVLGSIIYCRDFPTALRLLASRVLRGKPLITDRYKLKDLPKAIPAIAAGKPEMVKAIVEIAGEE